MTTKDNAASPARGMTAQEQRSGPIIVDSPAWRQCDACGYRFNPLRAWQILCGVFCGWPECVAAVIVLAVGVMR